MYRLFFAVFLVMIARLASAGCTIGSGQDPSFGQYNPELTSTSVINFYVSISCDTSTSYTLQAGPSTNSQSISSRYMLRVGGTERLNYQLCVGVNNVSCSTIFGDGSTGQPISGTASGGGATNLAYATALLYGSQQVPPGDYADIVPVTLLP
ncbi:spore coat U domain-containing protein [Jeongeupia naejangsanensis]|uniref:Spore coat protein U domain-containing protein n=1 Tax=Jeongeupia naejangsanensis TaxID=613195 RepID=A0ABS2BIA8_9NEIS|nr:spore coat protein U domain-containing protein [Jeongeupia naejangsanensis]MBM3115348.1 spore coat protein U domain-containing protein [Jeongeupia naejangsanensis]